MRNNIPYRPEGGAGTGNPALAQIAVSSQMRSVVLEAAEIAQAIYRDSVSKRTGRLAQSARVETAKGGRLKDRWIGRLSVGGTEAPHGLGHEFGWDVTNKAGTVVRSVPGAHDLNYVLNVLGAL